MYTQFLLLPTSALLDLSAFHLVPICSLRACPHQFTATQKTYTEHLPKFHLSFLRCPLNTCSHDAIKLQIYRSERDSEMEAQMDVPTSPSLLVAELVESTEPVIHSSFTVSAAKLYFLPSVEELGLLSLCTKMMVLIKLQEF